MGKRITFVPVVKDHEWADARFDVLLDGEKVAEAIRITESVDHGPATRTYASYRTERKAWDIEAQGYRSYTTSRSRVDAVVAFLVNNKGMTYTEAREAAGKKGL